MSIFSGIEQSVPVSIQKTADGLQPDEEKTQPRACGFSRRSFRQEPFKEISGRKPCTEQQEEAQEKSKQSTQNHKESIHPPARFLGCKILGVFLAPLGTGIRSASSVFRGEDEAQYAHKNRNKRGQGFLHSGQPGVGSAEEHREQDKYQACSHQHNQGGKTENDGGSPVGAQKVLVNRTPLSGQAEADQGADKKNTEHEQGPAFSRKGPAL